MQKLKIFISYSHADLKFARALYKRLQALGHLPWMDKYKLKAGERWADRVEEAVLRSDAAIGLFSTRGVSSDHVKDELELALANHKKLIPLRLEECPIPLNFIRLNYIDFARENQDPAWEQLEVELESLQVGPRPFKDWERLAPYLPLDLLADLQKLSPEARLAQTVGPLAQLLRLAVTFLPPHLAISLLENPLPPASQVKGEFLEGILLFARLTPAPLTALLPQGQTPKEQAEAATSIISRCLELILPILGRFEGRFIRFDGDTLLCLFLGSPQGALEAVAAALEIKSALAGWQIETMQQITPLEIQVNGPSASLFSANLGTPERLYYILTGSLAEKTALPAGGLDHGEVFISRDAYRTIQDSLSVQTVPGSQAFVQAVSLLKKPPEAASTPWQSIQAKLDDLKEDLPALLAALDAVTPHLPAGILPQLVYDPADPPLESQYRQVTVLAAACTGLSDLIQGYGIGYVDEITRVLNLFFKAMQDEVVFYGGTILRLDLYNPGDLLLAVFGAPVAHEQDPRRACLAARGMQAALRRLPADIKSLLKLSIGIDTGFAYTGTFGSSLAAQRAYSVLGNTVQSAEKLMAAAGEGQVLTSQDVWRTLQSTFDGAPVEIPTAGFDPGMLPAVSLGEAHTVSLERLVSHGHTGAFVGRDADLEKLAEAFETVIRDRCLTLLAVTGEAGVGKSRLVREWVERCRSLAPAGWIFAAAHSYGQKSNGVFVELLEKYLGLDEIPAGGARLDRLFAALKDLHGREGEGWLQVCMDQQAYLGHFLGLNLDEQPRLLARIRPLDAESLQIHTRQALVDILTHAARRQPLVMVLDDLHWADPESLDLLQYLTRKLDFNLPVLFCLIFRSLKDNPAVAAWQALTNENPNCILVALPELSQADAGALLASLLPGSDLPAAFQNFVQKKTDGNPLYIEELLNSMIENGAIVPAGGQWQLADASRPVQVPGSLYQIIQNRIDQLDFSCPGSRRLLWIAAAAGSECSDELVWHVYQSTGHSRQEYGRGMKELMNAALLQRVPLKDRRDPASLEYEFRHSLVQQVAYENIPPSLQSNYHAAIGLYLEMKYSQDDEHAARHAALLAYHFDAGRQWDSAFHYHLLAGEADAGAFANDSASGHFERALEIAPKASPGGRELAQAHISLGRLLALTGKYPAAQKHFTTAYEGLAEDGSDEAVLLRARICYDIGRTFERPGGHPNLESALSWQGKGFQSLADRPASPELALMHILGGIARLRWPDLDRAAPQIEAALRTAEACAAQPELALAHRLASMAARARGDLPAAREHCNQAAAICGELDDWIGKAKDLANLGVIGFEMDEWNLAHQAYQDAMELQEKIGDQYQLAMTCCNLGDLCFHLGNVELGLASTRRGLEIFEKIDAPEGVLFAQNVLATLLWRQGDYPSAEQALQTARRLEEELQDSEFHASIGRWLAQVYLSQGNLPGAESELAALQALAPEDLGQESGPLARLLAQAEALNGKLDEAIMRLESVLSDSENVPGRYDLASTRLALARFLRQDGQEHAARDLARQAQSEFESLGAALDQADATSFLAEV